GRSSPGGTHRATHTGRRPSRRGHRPSPTRDRRSTRTIPGGTTNHTDAGEQDSRFRVQGSEFRVLVLVLRSGSFRLPAFCLTFLPFQPSALPSCPPALLPSCLATVSVRGLRHWQPA